MSTLTLNWEEIESGCKFISNFLKDKNVKNVVGIARGGVIPGSIIARYIGADFHAISAKSYDESNKRGKLYVDPTSMLCIADKEGAVAFIDDICDSGNTLKEFNDLSATILTKRNFFTASLIYKENDIFTPSTYYKKVIGEEWVIFPWEVV